MIGSGWKHIGNGKLSFEEKVKFARVMYGFWSLGLNKELCKPPGEEWYII